MSLSDDMHADVIYAFKTILYTSRYLDILTLVMFILTIW